MSIVIDGLLCPRTRETTWTGTTDPKASVAYVCRRWCRSRCSSPSIADTLDFVCDFWAPTMILPFLVAVFWYRVRRIHAVVVSMIVGAISAVVWRFVLSSPGDIGPALFGVVMAALAYGMTLIITNREPTNWLF